MPPETDAQKQDLRRRLRAELRALPEADRTAGSRAVAAHLGQQFESLARDRPDAIVALFASLSYEIATGPIDDRIRSLGLARALPAYETGRLVFHAVPGDLTTTSCCCWRRSRCCSSPRARWAEVAQRLGQPSVVGTRSSRADPRSFSGPSLLSGLIIPALGAWIVPQGELGATCWRW
jgi:hypothetical protein